MIGRARTDLLEVNRSKLVALIAIFFVAGCGSQAEEAPSDHSAGQQRTATNGELSISKPPQSTLSFGGRHTVTGEIGSYCWSSPGTPATCADAAGIPVAHEQQTPTVPAGSVLKFDYGGEGRPASVQARAYPLEQEKQWLPGPEDTRLMRPKGGYPVLATEELKVHEEGDRIAIPAELSPGEYVVEVLVRVTEGDASYYFLVGVEDSASKRSISSSGPGY